MVDWSKHELEGDSGGASGPFVGKVTGARWEPGKYRGADLHLDFARSHPELTPGAKAEISWSWNSGPGWSISGDLIVHETEGKKLNANTALGKLLKAMMKLDGLGAALPDDWSPYSATSWKALKGAGDIEWQWFEQESRIQDESGNWIKNPDPTAKGARLFLPTAYLGGKSNGTGTFDISSLNLTGEQLEQLKSQAMHQDYGTFAMGVNGLDWVKTNPAVMLAISKQDSGEALRMALR